LDNGKNIYPEELETSLMTVEGVKDVMVYENKGKLCAACQPVDINNKEIIKSIKHGVKKINSLLPPYKRIVALDLIARDFPKTTTLKIKRKEALKMINEIITKETAEYVPPTTEEQRNVLAVFEKVLCDAGVFKWNKTGIDAFKRFCLCL